MAQRILGIDLGAHFVKIVVASGTFRGITVDSAERVQVQKRSGQSNLDAAIETALSMIESKGWGGIPAAVCAPAGSVSYRSLHFPFADPKRIAQTLPFELEGKFAQPIEDLVVDHVPAASGDGTGLGIVAAQSLTQAEAIKDRFKEQGVDVRTVTCGAFAIAQVAAALGVPAKYEGEVPGTHKPVTLVMDIGHRATEIAVLSGHKIVGARSFRVGAFSICRVLAKHGDSREISEINLHDPLTEGEAGALEPVSREVERLMHWLSAECKFYVTDVILAGGVSKIKGLEMWLAAEIARPCRVVTFDDTKVVKNIASYGDELSWAAIGSAHAGTRRPLIELQSLSDAADDESDLIKKRLIGVAMVGTCVLACAGIDTLAKVRAESRQRDAYRQELELLSQGVFGASVSDLDGVKTLLMGEDGNLLDAVPNHGALDVLAMITKAALPSDVKKEGGKDGAGPQDMPGMGGPDQGSNAAKDAGSGKAGSDSLDAAQGEDGEDQVLSVVPVEAGIVSDDRLYIRDADIREHKIVLEVSATRGSAKDRLKRKLEAIPCMKNIVMGTTRDYNEFKQFEVNIEHNCYFYKAEESEEEEN